MAIFIWNTRGINTKERRQDLKDQLYRLKPSFVGLVETKVKEHNSFRITRSLPQDWSFVNNYSYSPRGRIWIAWDTSLWDCKVINSSAQQITMNCSNKGGLHLGITVVYGANFKSQRLNLWNELSTISDLFADIPWAVGGDFNTARYTNEKIGGRYLSISQLRDFNECLDKCGLTDIRSTGSFWSWNNSSEGVGRITGRLDRLLGNPCWINNIPNSYYVYLNAATSDHSPLLLHLTTATASFPKPFRYFNYWAECQGYQEICKEAWGNEFDGNHLYQVICKLKLTKAKLREWSKKGFSSPKDNIFRIREAMKVLQVALDLDPLSSELHVKEKELKKELELWLGIEESQMRQKSRELWLKLGDKNSKFFYASVKNRYNKNSISHIFDKDGKAATDILKLRDDAANFYYQLYNQDSYWDFFPELTVKRKLTSEAAAWLIRDVKDEEIKSTVFQLNPDKAPGPDGFNARFFQLHWDVIGTDICKAVNFFFKHKRLVREINHTFLTLVPKSTNANSLTDFRPIACCNLLYKVITKLLTNRLQMVINDLISLNQSAFLKGRQISDCSLLAHELVRDFNKPMGSRVCMKVDLKKAFDSVNREFIYYMLHCMGFPSTWIDWIRECISTPSFSVMVEGSPAGFFCSNRGIRQGDPLSPYLFVIVMEFWSIQMDLAVAKGDIHPLKRGVPNQISHLLFADDMLVFCKGHKQTLKNLDLLFEKLRLNTGLSINKEKTKVYFSKGSRNKGELAETLGCCRGLLPVKYLGLPLSIKYPKTSNFGGLLDKLRARTEGWMTRVLSFAGRVELAKTVLLGSMNYWIQSFKLPKNIISELERIIGKFIWKEGLHSVSWDNICRPKKEGGLGLRKIKDMSRAAGVKLLWRLGSTDTLWATWMRSSYFANSSIWDYSTRLLDSGTIKFIMEARDVSAQFITRTQDQDRDSETLTWTGNSANNFSYASAWDVSRVRYPNFELYDVLWHQFHCPKWSYCLYKALSGKLLTRDRMLRFGMIQDAKCTLCDQGLESHEHLFFECPFSCYIWSCCMLKMGCSSRTSFGSINDEAAAMQQKFKRKNKLFVLSRLVLAGATWLIWKERNNRVFQKISSSKVEVVRRLYEDILVLLRTCHWKTGNDANSKAILNNWE